MVTDLAFYKNIDHQICYLGGAFAHSFSPEGQEFEWTNFEMFKCPMGFQGGGGEMLKLPLDKHRSSTLFQVPIWQPTIINPLNRTYDSHVTSPYIIKHTGNENIQTYHVEVVYLI